jgi:hypothetical protein
LQEKIRRISKIKTISTKDIPEGRGPVGTAIRERDNMLFVMTLKNDILNDAMERRMLSRDFNSLMSLPIKKGEK